MLHNTNRPTTRSLVRPNYSNVYIARSRIHGTGVYAAHDITARTRILPYDGTQLNSKEFAVRYLDVQPKYAMKVKLQNQPTHYIDAQFDLWALGRFINASDFPQHKRRPNCQCTSDPEGRLWITALRHIKEGEELLCPYGESYWGERRSLNDFHRVPTERIHLDRTKYCSKPLALTVQRKILRSLQEHGAQNFREIVGDPAIRLAISDGCATYETKRGSLLKQQLDLLERDGKVSFNFGAQQYLIPQQFQTLLVSIVSENTQPMQVDHLCSTLRGPRRCSNIPLVRPSLPYDPNFY